MGNSPSGADNYSVRVRRNSQVAAELAFVIEKINRVPAYTEVFHDAESLYKFAQILSNPKDLKQYYLYAHYDSQEKRPFVKLDQGNFIEFELPRLKAKSRTTSIRADRNKAQQQQQQQEQEQQQPNTTEIITTTPSDATSTTEPTHSTEGFGDTEHKTEETKAQQRQQEQEGAAATTLTETDTITATPEAEAEAEAEAVVPEATSAATTTAAEIVVEVSAPTLPTATATTTTTTKAAVASTTEGAASKEEKPALEAEAVPESTVVEITTTTTETTTTTAAAATGITETAVATAEAPFPTSEVESIASDEAPAALAPTTTTTTTTTSAVPDTDDEQQTALRETPSPAPALPTVEVSTSDNNNNNNNNNSPTTAASNKLKEPAPQQQSIVVKLVFTEEACFGDLKRDLNKHCASGLMVGPWFLQWNASGFCIPKKNAQRAVLYAVDIPMPPVIAASANSSNNRNSNSNSNASGSSTNLISSSSPLVTTTTTTTNTVDLSSMTATTAATTTEDIVNRLADRIVKWNTTKYYREKGGDKERCGNCQDFIDDILQCFGITVRYEGIIATLTDTLRAEGRFKINKIDFRNEFVQAFDLKMPYGGVTSFKTHKALDEFVCNLLKREPDLERKYAQEWILLKMVDRMFWSRHLRFGDSLDFQPLHTDRCSVGDSGGGGGGGGECNYDDESSGELLEVMSCPFGDPRYY